MSHSPILQTAIKWSKNDPQPSKLNTGSHWIMKVNKRSLCKIDDHYFPINKPGFLPRRLGSLEGTAGPPTQSVVVSRGVVPGVHGLTGAVPGAVCLD